MMKEITARLYEILDTFNFINAADDLETVFETIANIVGETDPERLDHEIIKLEEVWDK